MTGGRLRRAKIVCTLGPACGHPETIAAMIRAGMDVARLNTSHGTLEQHLETVRVVRAVAEQEKKPLGILMDLAGPKLRTGPTQGGKPITLETGAKILLTREAIDGTPEAVTVEYPRLTEDVLAGDPVLLDDGRIELEVLNATPHGLECRVRAGGLLGEHKGVNFPNTNLTMPSLTDRDRDYVVAGVRAGVDFFALSFVRDADDIVRTRELIRSLDADTPIVAKIERRQAIANLESILGEADGVMVARGDLGVELPPEEVPVQQRRIIAAAAEHMVPVITATEMLESMVDSPRPTRAESSDVANAAWEFSDALMLSEETAVGRYPVEAVAMMDRIIRRAETEMPGDGALLANHDSDNHSYVVALAARRIVESDPNMRGVVCLTRSGYTAILLSKVHPDAPVFALTPSDAIARRLALARSVVPIACPPVESSEQLLRLVDTTLTAGRHVAEPPRPDLRLLRITAWSGFRRQRGPARIERYVTAFESETCALAASAFGGRVGALQAQLDLLDARLQEALTASDEPRGLGRRSNRSWGAQRGPGGRPAWNVRSHTPRRSGVLVEDVRGLLSRGHPADLSGADVSFTRNEVVGEGRIRTSPTWRV